MFCPKCGEEISVRKKEDAEKIRVLREFIVWIKGTGMIQNTETLKIMNTIIAECK